MKKKINYISSKKGRFYYNFKQCFVLVVIGLYNLNRKIRNVSDSNRIGKQKNLQSKSTGFRFKKESGGKVVFTDRNKL